MDSDETWTSDEYGKSHEGRVGVLLADGTAPEAVYFDSSSGAIGSTVRHWSVYDGSAHPKRPRAHLLRAECACGWTGESHPVDWETASDLPFREHGAQTAGRCLGDWDQHTIAVAATTIPVPAELEALLESVSAAIEDLAKVAPTAAVKAARTLEIIAQRTAYWPAREAAAENPEKVAGELGLNAEETRRLLARFGGFSPYH
ncbi:hypothetical protein [Streptomyces sp. NPDC056492]|uniref:hypothetical protein n=1 Tax=unclassified Streptomyces TaxID=2593676 RepID=UPI0036C78F78